MIVLVVAVLWLIPLVGAVWAIVTLHRLRVGQDALRQRLDSIERLLQSSARV
jgi:hypothetical protein